MLLQRLFERIDRTASVVVREFRFIAAVLLNVGHSLYRDARGASVILMSFAAPGIIGGLALSIDMGIWYLEKRRLQQISDAASLGAVRVLEGGGPVSPVNGVARSDAERNGFVPDANSTLVVNSPPKDGPHAGNPDAVEVIATRRVPQFFASFFTNSTNIIGARSVAHVSRTQTRHLEVALMLDVSQSMASRSEVPGKSRLRAMQEAARSLINVVVQGGQEPFSSRVALIPYSSSVGVGPAYYRKVTNSPYTGGSTDVVERAGNSAFTEEEPQPGKYFPAFTATRTDSLGSFDSEGQGKNPTRSVINPLSASKAELISTLDNFVPSGTTAGHIGIAWTWYVMSPKWTGIWSADNAPKAYDSDKTLKIAVLMSDFDFNTSYQPANGDAAMQAQVLCNRLKASGITVYTVGYNVPLSNPRAVALWKSCASDLGKAYSARTVLELVAAFELVARRAVGAASTNGPGLVE